MTLRNHLNTLEATGLIHLAAVQPELEYLFRHALIQDAAYASLVKFDRAELHRLVGEALERLYPDRVGSQELAPQMAEHFARAGDGVRALKYFSLAGEAAAHIYANVEAALHYARALDIARREPVAGEPLLHLYTRRGRVLELSGQYAEALANYNEMEALARERGDRALELAGRMARATIHSTFTPHFDPAQGQALSEQALTLARELGDRQAESKILWNLLLLHLFTGRPREAVPYGEQSLTIAREGDFREQLAFTLHNLSMGYTATGQMKRARAAQEEAYQLWRELENQPMLAENVLLASTDYYMTGEYEQALRLCAEGYRLSQISHNRWVQTCNRWVLGFVSPERGEAALAMEALEEATRLGEQGGFSFEHVGSRASLGWLYGMLEAVEQGRELIRFALAKATAEQWPAAYRAWYAAILAQLEIRRGDLAAAEAAITEGQVGFDREDFSTPAPMLLPLAEAELALAKRDANRAIALMDELIAFLGLVGVRTFLADALHLKGQALAAQDRSEESHATLTEARAAAEALGSRRALWPVLAALAEIEAGRGHAAEAQTLRRQAREIIQYIADHCPPDLRASFLNLPDVRAVSATPNA